MLRKVDSQGWIYFLWTKEPDAVGDPKRPDPDPQHSCLYMYKPHCQKVQSTIYRKCSRKSATLCRKSASLLSDLE